MDKLHLRNGCKNGQTPSTTKIFRALNEVEAMEKNVINRKFISQNCRASYKLKQSGICCKLI